MNYRPKVDQFNLLNIHIYIYEKNEEADMIAKKVTR